MKKILREHWGVIFLTVIALSFIAVQAFFSSQRKKAVTEIYFADRMTEAHHVLIDEYNRLHAGKVKVVPIDFPNEDFTTNERKEVLARSLRGEGEGIDLFAVDVVWVQRFARWCEPLDPYFTPQEIEEFTDDGIRSCRKDGKLVAIPLGVVRGVLLYREDLVRALPGGDAIMRELSAGMTWDRFIELGKSLRISWPYYLFPAAEYEGLLCVFTELLLSREKNYFEVHGFNFSTPTAKESLQLLVDLVQRHRLSPDTVASMTEVPSYNYFAQHNGLFLRGWTIYSRDFFDSSQQQQSLRMAPVPHFNGGEAVSTVGGWNLMVSKFSPKKLEAIAFAKFLLRKESQEIIYQQGGFFPVIRSLYEDQEYRKKYPELIEITGMLARGAHRPSHEKYTKYSDILARYVSLAVRGRIGVDAALAQATKDIQAEKISL